ncbi:MAG: ammonium transporter [Clostridiales Family XIII bacterium]|jgi:Amt family ammonium transporter|nr:ammonium transporter [Clostridiales Family XIII bacterium]
MVNAGDTSFIIICTALVFIMTPGLGFFYGGLGRRKNVVSNLMNSAFILGIGIVLWFVLGYSIAFGGGGSIIGSFDHLLMNGIPLDEVYGGDEGTIPTYVFAIFQMAFALITPAIITGSTAGRIKFKALFFIIAIWSIIVYYPLAHMVWGENGFIGSQIGALDFAGGDVVHISSGVSGLVLALLVGKRQQYDAISYRVHNIPFVMLGMGLLWFGWFGFNAGSALTAGGLAGHAFLVTALAAAAALISWVVIDVIKEGKPTLIGACTGVVAGLVGITPAAGFVPIYAALIIGLAVSPVCYFGIVLIKRVLKIDDALDAFGCHGIGGIFGGLLTGVFAQAAIGGVDGLAYGNAAQLGAQALGIIITIGWTVAGTLVAAGIVRAFTPLRATKQEESVGLDRSQHGESAYPSFNGLD